MNPNLAIILNFLKGGKGSQGTNVKYYKREPKAKGGYRYWYTKEAYDRDHKKQEPKKDGHKEPSIWSKVASFFGVKTTEISAKIESEYKENLDAITKEAGPVTKQDFASHLAEYLANKAKWDLKFKAKKPEPTKETSEPKEDNGSDIDVATKEEKVKTPKEKVAEQAEKFQEGRKWNLKLMQFIASKYTDTNEKRGEESTQEIVNNLEKLGFTKEQTSEVKNATKYKYLSQSGKEVSFFYKPTEDKWIWSQGTGTEKFYSEKNPKQVLSQAKHSIESLGEQGISNWSEIPKSKKDELSKLLDSFKKNSSLPKSQTETKELSKVVNEQDPIETKITQSKNKIDSIRKDKSLSEDEFRTEIEKARAELRSAMKEKQARDGFKSLSDLEKVAFEALYKVDAPDTFPVDAKGNVDKKAITNYVKEKQSLDPDALSKAMEGNDNAKKDGAIKAISEIKKKSPKLRSQALRISGDKHVYRQAVSEKTSNKLKEVPASDIYTIEQYTDEKNYNRKVIEGIKSSILAKGFDPGSPIKVDRDKEGKLTVVDGHHRFTAVKELISEGKLPKDTPIYVIEEKYNSESDRLLAQVSANKNKREVERLDDAKAYAKLIAQGKSVQEISERTGESAEYVKGTIALNNLIPELQGLLRTDAKKNIRTSDKGNDGSKEKRETIPESLAIVIAKNGNDDNGVPSPTIQRKAFAWYIQNKGKGISPNQVKSYIDSLKAQNFTFGNMDSHGRSDVEQEAMKFAGGEDNAKANSAGFENLLTAIQKPIQKFLGDTITDLNEGRAKELAASIIATKGESALETELARLSDALNNIAAFRDSLKKKFGEIKADSQTPDMFAFKSSMGTFLKAFKAKKSGRLK
ncbi:unnamed protein product [Leptospira phage LE1]|uniref:ParB-like N-terminal domain-containing protein n=1 Tax=Leptospira phage LE1 TaxID=137511 RepID=Q6NE17_9CAUD|nr:ParB N-terminal domain-containing protein [Leptospira phage LE1]CAE14699.1 unnamed protein product [Leptospira phage LE1]